MLIKNGMNLNYRQIGWVLAMGVVVTHPAFAESGMGWLKDSNIKGTVQLAFGLGAGVSWIQYLAGFTPETAIRGAITPILLTYCALKFDTVIGWFGLGN